jgi:predicted DNA-binding transcriptional regulator YafY
VRLQPFERRVRRLLLLIPAARAAAPHGLDLKRALALTGARSVEELQADVLAVQDLAVSDDDDASHLVASVEAGKVMVDVDMGFGGVPPLSVREGVALMAALRPFRGDRPRVVERAVRKLERAVPDHLRREVRELSAGVDLAVSPPGPWADALDDAISRRLEVAVEYRSESDGTFSRKVLEPRALFPRNGQWYLVAWSVERGAEHLYRLDRVSSVEVGTRWFGDHKGPPLERLATRRLYLASGRERRVVLRFSPGAAAGARERWPRARARPDGGLDVELDTTPNEFLYGLVLGWGGAAEVVSPPDVRAELRRRVEALRDRYR